MVSWLWRRRVSVSSLAFAGWARRFRRARDPGTTIARSVSGRVRRHDVAPEYGARTAEEPLRGLGPIDIRDSDAADPASRPPMRHSSRTVSRQVKHKPLIKLASPTGFEPVLPP